MTDDGGRTRRGGDAAQESAPGLPVGARGDKVEENAAGRDPRRPFTCSLISVSRRGTTHQLRHGPGIGNGDDETFAARRREQASRPTAEIRKPALKFALHILVGSAPRRAAIRAVDLVVCGHRFPSCPARADAPHGWSRPKPFDRCGEARDEDHGAEAGVPAPPHEWHGRQDTAPCGHRFSSPREARRRIARRSRPLVRGQRRLLTAVVAGSVDPVRLRMKGQGLADVLPAMSAYRVIEYGPALFRAIMCFLFLRLPHLLRKSADQRPCAAERNRSVRLCRHPERRSWPLRLIYHILAFDGQSRWELSRTWVN